MLQTGQCIALVAHLTHVCPAALRRIGTVVDNLTPDHSDGLLWIVLDGTVANEYHVVCILGHLVIIERCQ